MSHELEVGKEKAIVIDTRLMKKALEVLIQSEHRETIAQVIIAHLGKTEMGLSHLFGAMVGELPILKYKIGESYKLDINLLPSWKFNKDKTLESDLCHQGFVLAKITSVNIFSRCSYSIKSEVMDDTSSIIIVDTMVSESQLMTEENFLREFYNNKS